MTSDLRIKKEPLPANLYLEDGTVLSGTVFLSLMGPTRTGLETIEELMSEPEAMLPFRTEEDRLRLVGKAGIVGVRMLSAEPKPDFEEGLDVEVRMRGGAQFNGTVSVAGEHRRLSDVINHAGAWLRLATDGGVIWIRRSGILVALPGRS